MTRSGTQDDVVLTVCRDEEDVIEAFVRFHLAMGFDAVYVVDNGSTDRTIPILRELVAEGLPIVLRHDDRAGYDKYLTDHYELVGRLAQPRWLFFLDCDEFVHFPNGVKHYLAGVDPTTNLMRLLQRQMFQAGLRAGSGRFPFLRTTIASTTFDDEPSKVISRYTPGAKVYGGKHRIALPDEHEIAPTDLFIRHYKYRSEHQARTKERNRISSERTFTDDDLRDLSSFPTAATRSWIEESRALAAREDWRRSFGCTRGTTCDDTVRRWLHSHLGEPPPPPPAPAEDHPVPGERVLLLELRRRLRHAGPQQRRIRIEGGSGALHHRLAGLWSVPRPGRVDALVLPSSSQWRPARIVATVIEDLEPTGCALLPAPHPEQDELVDLARTHGLQVMVVTSDCFGGDELDAWRIPVGSAVQTIVPHGRPENGILSTARMAVPS